MQKTEKIKKCTHAAHAFGPVLGTKNIMKCYFCNAVTIKQ